MTPTLESFATELLRQQSGRLQVSINEGGESAVVSGSVDLVALAGVVIAECAKKIGDMRQSEVGLLDPMHSGQRGQDRSNALWDAYQCLRRAKP